MPIRFYCPLGHTLVVPDHRAGKKGRCPICRQKVYVPVADPKPRSKRDEPPAGAAVSLDDVLAAELGIADTVPPPALTWLPATKGASLPILDPPTAESERGAKSRPELKVVSRPTSDATPPTARAPEAPTPWLSRARELEPAPLADPPPPPAIPSAEPLPAAAREIETPPPVPTVPAGIVAPQPVSPLQPPPPPPPPPAKESPSALESPVAATLDVAADDSSISRRAGARRWIQAASADMAATAARPDEKRLQRVYLLAGAVAGLALFGAAPAVRFLNFAQAPSWAQVVLMLTAAHLIYALWLISLPDSSTLWMGMLWCALGATLYGSGMALALALQTGKPSLLDLSTVRHTAGGWCAVNVLLLGTLSYLFGRASMAWRK